MKSRAKRIGLTSKAMFYAIIVHLIVGVLLVLNVDWPTHIVSSSRPKPAPVQANVIDESEIQKQTEAIRQKEEAEKQKQLEAQKKLDELLNKKREEEERLAEIRKQQETEKKKAEELAKKKEQEQLELAKLKKEEEQRKQAEAKAKAEAERKRKEEEQRRKEEEERKRKAAEEERAKELAAKQEREKQLQEQLEKERLQRRVNDALAQYIPIIKQKVSRNWNRPEILSSNIEAHVNVRLSQSGEVISARVVKSSGNPVFDRSVENAVLKASPLPIPQDRGVNEEFRNLKLIFKPEELIS